MATIIAILVIRLTHLEKSIEEQETKVNSQTSEIRDILTKEVRKGEQADIEEVINLVTRLTSLDTINGRLEYLDQSRSRWFIVDFASILFLAVVAILSTLLLQFDTLSMIFFFSVVVLVFLDIWNFIINYREFESIKRKLKDRKETQS